MMRFIPHLWRGVTHGPPRRLDLDQVIDQSALNFVGQLVAPVPDKDSCIDRSPWF